VLIVTDQHAYLLLLAVIVLWAGNFPLSKLALSELGPLTLTGARALIAAPLLLGIARLQGPLDRPLARRDYIAFVVLGMTGLVLNTTVWYWGLSMTTALNAGILGAASPILAAVAAALLLGDRLTTRNWIGIAVSVLAVLLTVAKGSLAVLVTLSVNRGDLIILLSQCAWIAYTLYARSAASTLTPARIMAGSHLVSALALVPLALAVERPWRVWGMAPIGWAVVLYGAIPVTLGHLWFYAVVRRIGASRTVTFMNLMPFAVIVLSWAVAGEAVHAYHLVGALLVMAGVYLTAR
jgi:drug/metabolite transporter (DMT)-like permease